MAAAIVEPIEGYNTRFRLVRPEDAEFIQGLRTLYGCYLSPTSPSVEVQRAWIDAYTMRQKAGQEYYFVIERREDGVQCGTMRIYRIGFNEATWGSFILNPDKPEKAALDSLLLVHRIIFEQLKLHKALFDVRKVNFRALSLYRRFGGIEMGSNDLDIFFYIDAPDFLRRAADLETHLECPH